VNNVRLGALMVAGLLGALGIRLLGGAPGARSAEPPALTVALRTSLEQDGCRADDLADPGRAHIPAASYAVDPPAGGDHDPLPASAGFYGATDVPADGHLVHALEHGFVIVWFRPAATPPATLDGLHDLARRDRWVLVAPRPSMAAALAATSWHRRLLCPDGAVAMAAGAEGPIESFAGAFRDQGPEKGFV
jgi:hypothetical protein